MRAANRSAPRRRSRRSSCRRSVPAGACTMNRDTQVRSSRRLWGLRPSERGRPDSSKPASSLWLTPQWRFAKSNSTEVGVASMGVICPPHWTHQLVRKLSLTLPLTPRPRGSQPRRRDPRKAPRPRVVPAAPTGRWRTQTTTGAAPRPNQRPIPVKERRRRGTAPHRERPRPTRSAMP